MMKVLLFSALTLMVAPFSQEGARTILAASICPQNNIPTDPVKQRKLNVLNDEIESLTNLRDYYAAKMARYRNRASSYEFQGSDPEESKKLLSDADKLQGVVEQIEAELARKEQERCALLR